VIPSIRSKLSSIHFSLAADDLQEVARENEGSQLERRKGGRSTADKDSP